VAHYHPNPVNGTATHIISMSGLQTVQRIHLFLQFTAKRKVTHWRRPSKQYCMAADCDDRRFSVCTSRGSPSFSLDDPAAEISHQHNDRRGDASRRERSVTSRAVSSRRMSTASKSVGRTLRYVRSRDVGNLELLHGGPPERCGRRRRRASFRGRRPSRRCRSVLPGY